ncbi:hypothetical protein GGU11DRAFT_742007 [Lentinula aff. detonsa]|nr:hypothetical protein GGU11DRAFT_742007 [Lentinula aff. detonsa]
MLEEEELSELSEVDELLNDVQGSTSRNRRGGSGGYNLQKALKPPRATTYTAQALYDQISTSDINLEPEYQRDVVWTKEKQTNLIDSILRNFYIPPIIFAVEAFEDGWETKTCIDGKQRLTSIQRRFHGWTDSTDPHTGEKLWYKDDTSETSKHGSKRRILPDKYRQMFANKQVVCVEYSGLTDADERDIFQRVQLGMALTSAEKLHVINTPRARFIRSLLEEFVSDTTLGSPSIPWDKSRGSDFRCIAQAVYLMDKWPTSKSEAALKHAGSLPLVDKWLSNTGADKKGGKSAGGDDDEYGAIPETFAKKVKETYSLMVEMAKSKDLATPFTLYPKVSPIEMICLSLLIYVHGILPSPNDRLDLVQLRDIIEEMRHDVREQHKDIRMNDRVGKTMIEFIQSIGDVPRKEESPAPSAKAKGKRRRVSDANFEEEDNDYEPHKRPSQSKKPKPQTAVRSKPAATGTPRTDHLAKARAAKAAFKSNRASSSRVSPPNPQRLPSPSTNSDAVVKLEPERSESQTPLTQNPLSQMSMPMSQMPPQMLMPMGMNGLNLTPEMMLYPAQYHALMQAMMVNTSQGMPGMQGVGTNQ